MCLLKRKSSTPDAASKLPLAIKNMPIAMGIIKMEMTLIMSLVEFISSEFGLLYFFALEVNFSM